MRDLKVYISEIMGRIMRLENDKDNEMAVIYEEEKYG